MAAITAVDVVGWSRLMATDEDGTWAAFTELRALIDPAFEAGGGRIVKSTGDGVLVESPSVVEAVRAALVAQEVAESWNETRPADRQLRLRIGVNLGDVIVAEDGDVYGDGVNVAARLEALADTGGICISDAAYRQVRGRIEARFVDRGEQWVKNIPTPVKVWAVLGGDAVGSEIDVGVSGLEHAEVIGSGGNATVYRAYQSAMDRWVAVKVIDGSDEATRRRFDRERQAMGRLSQHPGIVTIYDSGYTQAGRPYLVMPYLRNGSLQDRIEKQGPMPWAEAAALIADVAKAVDHAHRAGVVHRDLKPGNVMLDDEGRPLVADFGIARLANQSETVTGYLALTPAYSPPELLDGAEPSPAGDVYALAATFTALVSGTPPFVTGEAHADTLLALSKRIALDPPPDLRPLGVPDGIAEAVEQAMVKSPEERQASASDFGRMLVGAPAPRSASVATKRTMPSGGAVTDVPGAPWKRYVPAGAAVVAVGLVAVGLGAFGGGDTPVVTTAAVAADVTTTSEPAASTTALQQESFPAIEWAVDLESAMGALAVDDTSAYVLLEDGTLVAFDGRTGERVWPEPFDAGFGRRGLSDDPYRPAANLMATDNRVFFVRTGSKLIYAVGVADGSQDWRILAPFDAAQGDPTIDVSDGRLFLGFGQGIAALDLSSNLVWEQPTTTQLLVDWISAGGRLLAVTDGRSVYGLNSETGATLWRTGPPQIDAPVWLLAQEVESVSGGGRSFNRRVLILTDGGDLVMLDGETGAVRWEVSVSSPPGSPPEDIVYALGLDGQLIAVSAENGSELWSNGDLVADSLPVLDGGSVYVVVGLEVVTVNARSGSERGRVGLPEAPTTGLYPLEGTLIAGIGELLVSVRPAG